MQNSKFIEIYSECIESYSTVHDQQQLQSKEKHDRSQPSTCEIRKTQKWSRNFASQKSQTTNFHSTTGKKSCTIKASSATTRSHLNRKGLKHTKKPKTLLLTLIQKKRIENCEHWIADCVDWQKVVFSDEKKVNLDGLDHWKTWMWKNEKTRSKQPPWCGRNIMVWGMLFPSGKIFVNFLTSTVYQPFLQICDLPIIYDMIGDDFIFQQDNCSVHVSESSQKLLEERRISLLNWRARPRAWTTTKKSLRVGETSGGSSFGQKSARL